MSESIELDIEMWDNIKNMILSNDGQSSNLAFGILKNLDYNDESTNSLIGIMFGDMVKSRFKLEKRPD